jgi:hypothetical protein
VAKLFGHRPITSIEELRDGLTLLDSHRFRSTSCDASISFSESRSQATLSRSFGAFQSLEISRSRLEKWKSTDKEAKESKRSRSNSRLSRLREEYEARHGSNEEAATQQNSQNGSYKNRLFSCLVISPAGRTIKEFGSVKVVLTALCDAIKVHRSLLTRHKFYIEPSPRAILSSLIPKLLTVLPEH